MNQDERRVNKMERKRLIKRKTIGEEAKGERRDQEED